jgi:hypothetical protein
MINSVQQTKSSLPKKNCSQMEVCRRGKYLNFRRIYSVNKVQLSRTVAAMEASISAAENGRAASQCVSFLQQKKINATQCCGIGSTPNPRPINLQPSRARH